MTDLKWMKKIVDFAYFSIYGVIQTILVYCSRPALSGDFR